MMTPELLATYPVDALDDYSRVTGLARALDDAMAHDKEARDRYRAIWGKAWMPVSNSAAIEMAYAASDVTGH